MRPVFYLKLSIVLLGLVSMLTTQVAMADADEFPEQLIGEHVVAVVNLDLEKIKDQSWRQSIEALWPKGEDRDKQMTQMLSLIREWNQIKATRMMILFRSKNAKGESLSPVLCIQSAGTDFTRTKKVFTEIGLMPEDVELKEDRVKDWTRIYVKSQAIVIPEGMNLQFKIFRSLLHQSSDAPIRLVFSASFQMRQESLKQFTPKFPILEKASPLQQLLNYFLADISRNEVMSAELIPGPTPSLTGKLYVKNQERAVYVHHDQADFLDRMKGKMAQKDAEEIAITHLLSEALFYQSDQDKLHFRVNTQALSILIHLLQAKDRTVKVQVPATQPAAESYVERMKSNDRQIIAGPQKPKATGGIEKVALDETLSPEERDQESAVKMYNLLTVIQVYSNANQNKLPKTLSDLGTVVGGSLKGMLVNPSTGDSPGYIYVKPDKALKDIKLKSKVPILYESRDGKKVEGGWVGYLNGKVRRPVKEKE